MLGPPRPFLDLEDFNLGDLRSNDIPVALLIFRLRRVDGALIDLNVFDMFRQVLLHLFQLSL